MSNFLSSGVMDLRSTISSHSLSIGGDGHYFEESDSPEKLKSFLDSPKVRFSSLTPIPWLLYLPHLSINEPFIRKLRN